MKQFFTPMVIVLVVAMVLAFAIGSIGGRSGNDVDFTDVSKNTQPEKASEADTADAADAAKEDSATEAEDGAAQEATEQADTDETAATDEQASPAPQPPVMLHKTPLTTLLQADAVEQYKLQTFADIVTKANLEGLMTPEDGGQLTVFLPTDTGFGYLGEDARAALVDGDFATADRFLKAHLVAGRYTLAEIAAKATDNTLTLTTLGNTTIKLVRAENGPWAIETPEGLRFIMRPDVVRENGVGQVIDAVLPSE